MPPITDPSKLSVRQFAEQFRGEMIPLSNSISYYCASVPMSEDDLKEYLQEPVAALPPSIASALPKLAILWSRIWSAPTAATPARTNPPNMSRW